MMHIHAPFLTFLFTTLLATAITAVPTTILPRAAPDRSKWGIHDIKTDYDHVWPNTGVVREYWLTVENVTMDTVDGYERSVIAYNGSVPGPLISADWGDTIVVHLKNNLANNGTGIHWHGMRQLNNNRADGVNGITECPLAPGDTKTYRFQATQYGTSWYHSHFSLQYSEGANGPLVIRGPASADYDEDLGVMMLSDWHHRTAFSQFAQVQQTGPTTAVNALINGTNVFDCATNAPGDPNCKPGKGRRYEKRGIEKGKRYLVRLVNSATDNHFKVSLDGHKLQVISTDFVPIVPFETEWLDITVGQRYDVIIEASADSDTGSYWFRSVAQLDCSFQLNTADVRGIFHYSRADTSLLPTTSAYPMVDKCLDMPNSQLVPVVPKTVAPLPVGGSITHLVPNIARTPTGLIRWTINNSPMAVNWSNPITSKIRNSEPFLTTDNTYDISAQDWVYLLIDTTLNVSHPIHLHGHDFHILASGEGPYLQNTPLKFDNPPRRDVATMPALGYVVIAFEADNPGAWLLHCHIAFHVSMGFSVQFIEDLQTIKNAPIDNEYERTCKNWRDYVTKIPPPVFVQDDSGI